ncbi:MAG: glycosyltransferase family 39 protein [Sedimentisphaerales bacterium]|nr:glycosyltransferase family 39 protein [Sedimentisphaerales bacterium]
MRVDFASGQSGIRQDVIHVGILLAIGLAIGIYLISTSVVIAKDGVTFIEYARNLEVASSNTMINEDQHPGYPYLILIVHKVTRVCGGGSTLLGWVYSAQTASLIFRLLAILTIYLLGRLLAGSRDSFPAILILILLPLPAGYGSDALSDWPHMFFLAAAMLSSIIGAVKGRWWLFGLAGVLAGAGYLVRPECAQVVGYSILWLTIQFFLPGRNMSRPRIGFALAALTVGFCVLAAPYMYLKGAVFPKKDIGELASAVQVASTTSYAAVITPADIAKCGLQLFGNIGETVMWFFVPPLFIGVFDALKRRAWIDPKKFFTLCLLACNATLMIWLYTRYGYMSKRHTLPIVVFSILYIGAGLRKLAALMCGGPKSESGGSGRADERRHFVFVLLMVVGISICIPKLLRPIHHDRRFIRLTSRWLADNTDPKDVLAVSDIRISFYAERIGIVYHDGAVPGEAGYVVDVLKDGRGALIDKDGMLRAETSIEDESGNDKVIIYRRTL